MNSLCMILEMIGIIKDETLRQAHRVVADSFLIHRLVFEMYPIYVVHHV